jgi:hypothetical protein
LNMHGLSSSEVLPLYLPCARAGREVEQLAGLATECGAYPSHQPPK